MADNVLLIDDEQDFLDVMTERMEARGFEVSSSMSAEDALGMIKKGAYDAIILDLQMPGMDGIEALKAIKEIQPEAQIILLTGHAHRGKRCRGHQTGRHRFHRKTGGPGKPGAKDQKRPRQENHDRGKKGKRGGDRRAEALRDVTCSRPKFLLFAKKKNIHAKTGRRQCRGPVFRVYANDRFLQPLPPCMFE